MPQGALFIVSALSMKFLVCQSLSHTIRNVRLIIYEKIDLKRFTSAQG